MRDHYATLSPGQLEAILESARRGDTLAGRTAPERTRELALRQQQFFSLYVNIDPGTLHLRLVELTHQRALLALCTTPHDPSINKRVLLLNSEIEVIQSYARVRALHLPAASVMNRARELLQQTFDAYQVDLRATLAGASPQPAVRIPGPVAGASRAPGAAQ